MKKDITPLSGALDKVLQLGGVTYKWKDPAEHGDRTGTQMGMIAQDVEKVFPEWVKEGADGYKSLDIVGFEGLMVEAIKETNQKFDPLLEQIIEDANKI